MQNYRRHLEEHLLPEFEDKALAEIQRTDVDAWERKEKALYAVSSVKTWRGTLHLLLEDAVEDGLISANPATKRRGRGKRAGRSRDRGPEKVVTDPLGILLVAERASLLSGRDDEFVAAVTKGYTGMRWGEVVGLEVEFARPKSVRIEWQLYELDSGELVRCPPKEDSYRTVDAPPWLSRLWTGHIARTQPTPCPCHGRTYMFRGQGVSRTGETGAKVVDVARRAGCIDRHGLQRPQPARNRGRSHEGEGASGDRGSRVHPWRRCCRPGRALAAERVRYLAVHTRRFWLVPEEGATGGPARAGTRGTVARRTRPRARRPRARRYLLGPRGQGTHAPRATAHAQDAHGRFPHAAQAHG